MFQDNDTLVGPWIPPKGVFAGKVEHVIDVDLADSTTITGGRRRE
ncbi:MAG: hypothetical protein ABSG53_22115 [Thermoguttaceae bacterium]|jgi:hypothetical protein